MDSRTLGPEQTERLRESLRPHLQYLRRLIARMDQVGFVAGDPLYQRVKAAYNAMHDLHVHLHYLGCEASRLAKQ
jgi:hypothetical protein